MPSPAHVLAEPMFSLPQIAKALPARDGTIGIHQQTLLRRIKRGEFPPPDVQYADGTRLWKESTLRAAGL